MNEELYDESNPEEYSDDAELVQLVGMKLGEEEYAVDVLKIQEIIRTVEITIVPRMDSYILGVMNLRGKVIPVIDLRIRFSLDNYDFDKSTRIIVVRFEKQNIGFVVDEVTEVIRIRRSMVEPTPPLVGSIGQEYILGICKYDARLIMLLDIDRVVSESGEHIESELRKKVLGPKQQPSAVSVSPVRSMEAEITEVADFSRNKQEETGSDLPNPDSVPSPLINEIKAETTAMKGKDADSGITDDIDAMIAKELAKREAETEELNKKKRNSQPSSDEVLKDALAQSAAMFSQKNYVEQGDLDNLIAQELAKREAETDELNRKRREEHFSEKKNDLSLEASENNDYARANGTVSSLEEEVLIPETGAPVPEENGSKADAESIKVSIKELKRIADKIIAGEEPESLNINIKGEIGELLRLIIDTKAKVDELNPLLETSKETMPVVTSVLEDVNHDTEKASINLMEASESMSSFYKNFINDVARLKELANKEHEKEFMELHSTVRANLSNAESLGFKILESLEFQDITEQKLRKVIKSIEDMGARIGTIVGFLQVQGPKSSDKRMDKLLVDYGLA